MSMTLCSKYWPTRLVSYRDDISSSVTCGVMMMMMVMMIVMMIMNDDDADDNE